MCHDFGVVDAKSPLLEKPGPFGRGLSAVDISLPLGRQPTTQFRPPAGPYHPFTEINPPVRETLQGNSLMQRPETMSAPHSILHATNYVDVKEDPPVAPAKNGKNKASEPTHSQGMVSGYL